MLKAFAPSEQSGQQAEIATVVKTVGSVYRRSGARMFLTEAGSVGGAIGGSCLESEGFERAKPLLTQNSRSILVQSDTTASDDVIWGLGLATRSRQGSIYSGAKLCLLLV